MTGEQVIELIGFDRAISSNTEGVKPSESESILLKQIKGFGVDRVYFNTDDKGNGFHAIFLKKIASFDATTLQEIANVHRKIWNYKKVLFLYVYADTEIRIYNCSEKPIIKTKANTDYEKELHNIEIYSCKSSDKEQLEQLELLFSRVAIDSGSIWTLEEAKFIRYKIDLKRRVDKYLVSSLINTAKQLAERGLQHNIVHKIILRSLFLLYLEDRGAIDEKFYGLILKGAKTYFDILDDVGATYRLYKKLEDDFNGNVFTLEEREEGIIINEQLQIIKKCFRSGDDDTPQANLFEEWRLFDFSIIQIELLSEIYERFLFSTDPELKKRTGTYYTPPALVEFILNEKLPINDSGNNYNVKILDPSCGSGIFLVESFKRLVKRYENCHKEELTDFDQLKKLLTDNIFGIELHQQAIKVAAFSLYLALVDKLDPKNIWQSKKHRLPNLINDPNDTTLKVQGANLYCRDTIEENKEIEAIEFDLVVGNPPFGTSNLSETVRNYCDENGFAKEMVLPFLHKATSFSKKGEIALIFNTKVLTNTGGTYQHFRSWLFNECYVEKVFNFSILRNAKKNFGGQLFGDATEPISIVFYKKEQPQKRSDKIAYYAPKTYIKTNVIEGLSIDFSDLKYLPREECEKPDTKIWKVAMWGGMNDWKLITQIDSRYKSLKSVFKDKSNKWQYATGLNADSQKLDFIPDKIIDTKRIQRYYTSKSATYNNTKLYRNIDARLFRSPFIVVKQAQANRQIAASYIDYDSYCLSSAYVINGSIGDFTKKALVGVINSKFSKYYLFMVASSWGIERERASFDELLSLPFLLLEDQQVSKIAESVNSIITKEKTLLGLDVIISYEKNIDFIIQEHILKLSEKETYAINDCLDYSLDLFEHQDKSLALFPTSMDQILAYGGLIANEINDFLDGQDLYVNTTVYNISRSTPLMMIKLSFGNEKKPIETSDESVNDVLKTIDNHLWEQQSTNIFFRKTLNYKTGDDVYIIRPNQRRYWSKSMAIEDASELILEILNGN